MSKRTEINNAMKEALKTKDQVALSTIRLITSAMKDKDIAARPAGNADGIGDAEILSMLQSMVKQRKESAKIYVDAGRTDLSEKEEQEIAVIEKFLPQQLGDDEVAKIVAAVIAETGAAGVKDMGKVMGVLKSKYAGQIDMAKAGGVVKEKLG